MAKGRGSRGGTAPKPPPPPPPTLGEKILAGAGRVWKRISRPIKLPGWALVLLWIAINIPDWKSRYDFWLGSLQQFNGALGFMGFALQNPLFGAIVLSLGVGYLVFVGEPKGAVLRSHWWPYVGWTTAGLMGLAVVLAVFAGSIASVISPTPRHLTTEQQRIIIREARAISPAYYWDGGKKTIALSVMSVDMPEANAYTIEIMASLMAGKIPMASALPGMLAPVPMRALSPGVRGVFFQVRDLRHVPLLAARTAKVLTDAQIKNGFVTDPILRPTDFILTVALP